MFVFQFSTFLYLLLIHLRLIHLRINNISKIIAAQFSRSLEINQSTTTSNTNIHQHSISSSLVKLTYSLIPPTFTFHNQVTNQPNYINHKNTIYSIPTRTTNVSSTQYIHQQSLTTNNHYSNHINHPILHHFLILILNIHKYHQINVSSKSHKTTPTHTYLQLHIIQSYTSTFLSPLHNHLPSYN